MNDPVPAVRRQAISAAGALKATEFVIPLIYKTQSVDTLQEAVTALSAYGSNIVPTLAKVLANKMEDAHIRRAVARVLGRLGTPEAVEVITRHLDETDEELRTRLFKSLARAVKAQRVPLKETEPVLRALDQELTRAYRALFAAETLKLSPSPAPPFPRSGMPAAEALLASALSEKIALAEHRVFLLLGVLYPDAGMERIYEGIHDASAADAPRRRANAVELLDNLLDRSLKNTFLPLFDDLPRADRLKLIAGFIELPKLDAEQVILALCRDETAWVRSCAVWYAGQVRHAAALGPMLEAASDASPVVREAALVALSYVAPEQAAAVASAKLSDEAPVVRKQAALFAVR
jgi:HEAT repeat protein